MNRKIFYNFFSIIFLLFSLSNSSFSQLVVTPGVSAATLASTLAGPGVIITSPTLTCPTESNGTFTTTGTLLAMSNGIVLTNGKAAQCAGPEGTLISTGTGGGTDPLMVPLLPAGTTIVDACYLDFNMVAQGDSIGFNYQFGSEEYRNAVCSIYTDVFAFFISGPGIVGNQNMATVPGTTIPVEINSVNNGGLGTVGGAAHVNCTSLGAGSPFTGYYIDNTGGALMSYRGYTTKFRAVHAVTACDTYHLHISIVDAGDNSYDSGVFLEGESLTTNTYSFNHADSIGATINSVPHTIVKGCNPTTVNVIAAHSSSAPTVLNLSFGGTAVNGVDVATIPNTVTLPAGSTTAGINVQGIPTPPGGSKTLTIYLMGACGIADSVTINILDTPSAHILTPDTTVCAGQSFHIHVSGTSGLSYSWAPPGGLSSITAMQPICTPTANAIYTMTATLPGSGCPAIVRTIAVNIGTSSINIVTPDTSICAGASVDIIVDGSPTNVYSWIPSTGLNSSSIQDPIATLTVTTTYTVTTSLPGGGCAVSASITIAVIASAISILTPDTTICNGGAVNIVVNGIPGAAYIWTPATNLSNPNIEDPIATPTVTTTYTVTSSTGGIGGCPAQASITITVPNPNATILTPDTTICAGMPVNIRVSSGAGLTYSWTPAIGLNNPNIMQPIAIASVTTTYVLTETYAGTPCTASEQFTITIAPPLNVIATSAVQACNTGINLTVIPTGSDYLYLWTGPVSFTDSLPNPHIANVTSAEGGKYYVSVFDMANGCIGKDSTSVTINAVSLTLLTNVTTNQTISYGSSVQLNASNVNFYYWKPDDGTLNNPNISDPIATPMQNTTYTVYGLDSSGCMDSASVTVNVIFDSITIPSAFTPNGDGLNDIFRPIGMKYQKLVEFSIYNRWGQQIFTTNNKEKGWDGTFNGVKQEMDVYNYVVIAALDDGTNRFFKGTVTLVR